MPKKTAPSPSIQAKITGNINGQVAVGQNIVQIKRDSPFSEVHELNQVFAELRKKVAAEAPADKKEAALERVGELEQAITEPKPDLPTMEYVKNWFGKHLPGLAGAVVSVVVHPLVGKLVEAAGDVLTADFKKRFG